MSVTSATFHDVLVAYQDRRVRVYTKRRCYTGRLELIGPDFVELRRRDGRNIFIQMKHIEALEPLQSPQPATAPVEENG